MLPWQLKQVSTEVLNRKKNNNKIKQKGKYKKES